MAPPPLVVRSLALPDDLDWATPFLDDTVAGRLQARPGELVDTLEGGGVVASVEGRAVGLLAWFVDPASATAEIRALAVAPGERGRGVGRRLLAEAREALRGHGVRRVWLVTTNDNFAALALYQKAGYRLSALRAGALDELRRTMKPSIPSVGEHGIPLRDELELEMEL